MQSLASRARRPRGVTQTLAVSLAVASLALALLVAAPACMMEGGALRTSPPNDPVRIKSSPRLMSGYRTVLAAQDIDGVLVGQAAPEVHATAVVVFASWCGPCRQELAILGELLDEQTGLRVIGVNAFEDYDDRSDEAKLRAFVQANAPWLQVVRATPTLLASLNWPTKVPSLYIFDRHGVLVQAFVRARRDPPSKPELEAAVQRAMRIAQPTQP